MKHQNYNDEYIVKLLCSNKKGDDNYACLILVQKYGQELLRYMQRQGMRDKTEIKSILNWAIAIFISNVRMGKYVLTKDKPIVAFIKRVARNKWIDEIKQMNKYVLGVSGGKEEDLDEIDRYLKGTMASGEQFNFMVKLNEDAYLYEEVEKRQQYFFYKRLEVSLFENVGIYREGYDGEADSGGTEKLKRAIQELDPSDQDLMICIYFKNITLKTYAEINKIVYDTVKQRHKRAKEKLIKIYKNTRDA